MSVSDRVGKSIVTARAYCKCGGAMKVTAPKHVVDKVLEIFWEQHIGTGHGVCDATTARKERARQDRAAAEKS